MHTSWQDGDPVSAIQLVAGGARGTDQTQKWLKVVRYEKGKG